MHGPLRFTVLLLALAVLAACSRQEQAWQQAGREDTVASYQAYLQRYPAGGHAAEAAARIRALQDDGDWAAALRLATPEALQRYLVQWPEGRHADEARARLAAFLAARAAPAAPAAPRPVAGSWDLQLGAFSNREAAQAAWQRLAAAHPELLGERRARLLASQDGRLLWRLRAPGGSEQQARSDCATLAARGADCLAVPAGD